MCTFDPSAGRVVVRGHEGDFDFAVGVKRDGSRIEVLDYNDNFKKPDQIPCGNPTVHNVDRIVLDSTAAVLYETSFLDLRGGRLEPGRTEEQTPQASEIELKIKLDERTNEDGSAGFYVIGSKGGDNLNAGSRGGRAAINFNASEEKGYADADAQLDHPAFPKQGAPSLKFDGRAGNDVFVGTGGPGVGGTLGARQADLTLTMGKGDDRLVGGRGDDYLHGKKGEDVYLAGDGDDWVRARDGVVERIECGGGKDEAEVDGGRERARAKGCDERETRRAGPAR